LSGYSAWVNGAEVKGNIADGDALGYGSTAVNSNAADYGKIGSMII